MRRFWGKTSRQRRSCGGRTPTGSPAWSRWKPGWTGTRKPSPCWNPDGRPRSGNQRKPVSRAAGTGPQSYPTADGLPAGQPGQAGLCAVQVLRRRRRPGPGSGRQGRAHPGDSADDSGFLPPVQPLRLSFGPDPGHQQDAHGHGLLLRPGRATLSMRWATAR